MILGFLARFFASFLISNWIYSEVVLFYPPFDSFAKTVYRTAQLPTHDKWGDLADPEAAGMLAAEIEGGLARHSRSASEAFSSFFDERIRQLWNAGSLMLAGHSSVLSGVKSDPSFLSGEDIFVRRTTASIRHATF